MRSPDSGDTYAEAHRVTEETGKPMVVMVGTDWCSPCQMMKKTILPRVREHGLLRRVAFAVVNPDRDGELADQITGGGPIPQLVMFRKTAKGWVRKKLVGGQSVETVEEFINEGLASDAADKKADKKTPSKTSRATTGSESCRRRLAVAELRIVVPPCRRLPRKPAKAGTTNGSRRLQIIAEQFPAGTRDHDFRDQQAAAARLLGRHLNARPHVGHRAGHQAQPLAAQRHRHVDAEQRDPGGLDRGIGRGDHAHAAERLDHAQRPKFLGPERDRLAQRWKHGRMNVRNDQVVDDRRRRRRPNPARTADSTSLTEPPTMMRYLPEQIVRAISTSTDAALSISSSI